MDYLLVNVNLKDNYEKLYNFLLLDIVNMENRINESVRVFIKNLIVCLICLSLF